MLETLTAHPLLTLAAVALVAFIVGRMTANPKNREQRQRDQRINVEHILAGLPTETRTEIATLLAHGQKIQAIKLLRERRTIGLREAKDVVERIESKT